MWKKFLGLFHYWQAREQLTRELGAADLTVLTITSTPSRLTVLRELACEIDPDKRGTDIFWFATLASLTLDNPEHVLFDDTLWTTAAGKTGALF
jgi:hypothetical protein